MIKLSERLQTIADYIENQEDTADIGTDHGYLPLFLLEQNPDRKIIFTDVNEGPLSKTRNIIMTEYPDADLNGYDIRIGDGLEPLENAEVENIVIAGMGGILIKDILGADLDKTHSFKKFILQPRTAADKLRKWLVTNDFYIFDEQLAYENGRICEIIAAVPCKQGDTDKDELAAVNKEFKDELDYEFSPILLKKETQIITDWLSGLLQTEKEIETSIINSGSAESREKLIEIKARIDKLHHLIKR